MVGITGPAAALTRRSSGSGPGRRARCGSSSTPWTRRGGGRPRSRSTGASAGGRTRNWRDPRWPSWPGRSWAGRSPSPICCSPGCWGGTRRSRRTNWRSRSSPWCRSPCRRRTRPGTSTGPASGCCARWPHRRGCLRGTCWDPSGSGWTSCWTGRSPSSPACCPGISWTGATTTARRCGPRTGISSPAPGLRSSWRTAPSLTGPAPRGGGGRSRPRGSRRPGPGRRWCGGCWRGSPHSPRTG